jgi:hypothetical protein
VRRHALQRDLNEPEIIDALEKIGCSVVQLHTPCDLLVGRVVLGVPRTFLLEVKNPDKSPAQKALTKDQVAFRATWRGHYAVVETVAQALAAVGVDSRG